MLQMVGTDMNASINEALNRFKPVARLNVLCKNGATITIPKKPITTEGNAARSSTTGLAISRNLTDAISARYSAVIIPKGIEIRAERKVTAKDATRRGRIPKSGGDEVGYHSNPKRNAPTDSFLKMGRPSANKKSKIIESTRIEVKAVRKKIHRIACSFI
ncbi:hypothetical protein DAMNIGENAA_02570 [Desulforhabdus amnigena]|uniref:Uncharacterized protein n=1 Tax=Desulforhabdus amnigena TaxID=40218 RepID=A0A9W6FRB1_9BACT|nr:hypothetical protein DAMNIGENAA_02570 [Desulforhabdus amnigena]